MVDTWDNEGGFNKMQEVEPDQQFAASDEAAAPAPVEEWSSNDIGMSIFVTLGRIYDLMAIVAIGIDPEAAGEGLALHENGLRKGAPPSLSLPTEDDEEPQVEDW